MSFSAAWLELREPADRAARDPALLAKAVAWLESHPVALDLGCGTGATARAFGVPGIQWRLVDRDAELLEIAARRVPGAEVIRADLRALVDLPFAGARLVTASALLDLMPRFWLQMLATRLAVSRIAVYAALSFDGRIDWTPELDADRSILDAFNTHQLRDKGIGPAMGPAAGAMLAEEFAGWGYEVAIAPSCWRLGPRDWALQNMLIDGIAAAAAETGLAGVWDWVQARRAAIGSGSVTVGHADMLALPPESSAQSKMTSVPSP